MRNSTKVLVSLDIPKVGIDLLRAEGLEVSLRGKEGPMSHKDLLEATLNHDILISSSTYQLDAEFLELNRHVRLISQFAAGYDNINLDKARELGITIANTPNAMTEATADTAFGLLLAVSRKMFYMHKKIISDDWGPFRPQANLGMELKGKTLGILGLGRIGMAFARRCKGAYGMNVIYHNRHPNQEAEQSLNAKYRTFSELLAQSDILSVHTALTKETAGLINADALRQMKPTSIFINTARGAIHNETDLIAALNEKIIWGAGLDVTNPEPMQADNPLLAMENVAVTPHIGSATVEARNEMSRLAAMNVIHFVRGDSLENKVV